jgi:hypothetical protein
MIESFWIFFFGNLVDILVSRALKDTTKSANQGPDSNRETAPVFIHYNASEESAKDRSAAKSRVDGADDGGCICRVEELEEVRACDHVGHDTAVVTEKKGPGGVVVFLFKN